MTKLRTVGVVAAFIATCGAGGFIAGATLDERCRTDTATKVDDDTAFTVYVEAIDATEAAWDVRAVAHATYRETVADDEVANTVYEAAVKAVKVAEAVYEAAVKAEEAAKAAYIEVLTD